jgi:hypothetical protein
MFRTALDAEAVVSEIKALSSSRQTQRATAPRNDMIARITTLALLLGLVAVPGCAKKKQAPKQPEDLQAKSLRACRHSH